MNILFFSHYFPPEVNAPATRTYEHCVRWAAAGHDVTVVTCAPNCPDGVVYPGYRNRLRRQVEFVDGVRVVRVWTYLAANAGTVRRIANYLSYMIAAVWTALWLPRPDVVVATSPQFFCGWAGVIVQWLKRVPFVLEIRDIWPESIETVGAIRNRPVLRFLQWMERRMYRAADHIVAVGQGYRDKIVEKAAWCKKGTVPFQDRDVIRRRSRGTVPFLNHAEKADVADRISVITNGVDLRFFVPGEPDPRFLHLWDLEDKFVCSYVGTIGMAHGLEVVLGAARLLKAKGRDDIRFCLVGDGAMRERLEDQALRDGLERLVIFTGRQPKEEIPPILASSGACLIHLRNCELFGTVLPSKIFETMAMGRPIILGVNGEARQIVLDAGAGVLMEPDSAESLVAAVEALADEPERAAQAGSRARECVAEKYNRDVLAQRYLELLCQVAGWDAAQSERPDAQAEPAVKVFARTASLRRKTQKRRVRETHPPR